MINGYGNWAQQYRARLWTGVLPLPPKAKSPVPKGHTGRGGTTPDDAQIEAWCRRYRNGNIALRMPGDVLGIDVDDYAYEHWEEDEDGEPVLVRGVKTGAATLAALEAELGPLPATWRSSSRGDGPSGIRFYRVPPGLLWGDFGTHLEGIWWGHRYAVVYPSVNPDSGLQYLWINDGAESPRWGAEPPKITDIAELPESWTARFGRAADAPKPPRSAGPAVVAHRSPLADYGGTRAFTRKQAADFVQPHLDALRAAPTGSINNRLNDAAKVLSHFVPAFWSPLQAQVLVMDALSATAYDGKTWQAERTVQSAFDSSAADWTAELVAERERPARARPRRDDPDGAREQEPPADDQPPPDDGMDELIEGFWDRRPFLRHVDTYARSRYAAPWAVLGSALAIAVAAVEPNIQLPAIIGTEASLNLFVGLVGTSGGGKDNALGVARRMLDIRLGTDPVQTEILPLGSGEGITHAYMKLPPKPVRRRKGDDEDSEAIGLTSMRTDEPVQYRTRALFTVAEIDTLEAQKNRSSATVSGQLRQGWSGTQLGFQYATADRRMIVPEHVYRMCLIAGIQPGRGHILLSGAESDGGTPQRFLWLPANDPTMRRDAPDIPPPMAWQPPAYTGHRITFDVCPSACDTVIDAHLARQRGEGDALNGHALLTRLKVAAALAMLDDREPRMQCTITEEDWELSAIVMAVSERTREYVRRHLTDAAKEENRQRAKAEAMKAITVAEVVENDSMSKAVRWLRTNVSAEGLTRREIQQGPKSLRGHLMDAVQKLVERGELVADEYQSGTRKGTRYRRP